MTELPTITTGLFDGDAVDARIGDRLLVKGRLDAVLYGSGHGKGSGSQIYAAGSAKMIVRFSDWTDMHLPLESEAMARTISFPLSTQVTVLVEKIDDDGALRPLSVWDASRVPIPLMPSLLLSSVALSANSVREP